MPFSTVTLLPALPVLCVCSRRVEESLLLLRLQDSMSLQSAFDVTACLPGGPALIRSQARGPHGTALNVEHFRAH